MLEDIAISVAEAIEHWEDFDNVKVGDVRVYPGTRVGGGNYATFKITDSDGDVYVVQVRRG